MVIIFNSSLKVRRRKEKQMFSKRVKKRECGLKCILFVKGIALEHLIKENT